MADVEKGSTLIQGELTKEKLDSWRRNTIASTCALPLTIAIYYFGVAFCQPVDLLWAETLSGAAGWYVALLLRLPFILMINKLLNFDEDTKKILTVFLSGPCEEGIRVLLVSVPFGNVPAEGDAARVASFLYSVGFGWAAVEVLYVAIQNLAMLKLYSEDSDREDNPKRDEIIKARNAVKEFLGKEPTESSSWYGVAERVSASAFHIGLTLGLGLSLYLAIAFALVHSLTNYSIVAIMRRYNIAVAETLFFVIGAAVFGGFYYAIFNDLY